MIKKTVVLLLVILALVGVMPISAQDASPAVALDLSAYPIVPDELGIAAEVFAHGQMLDRDPHVISKVGDCNSVDWLFLHPFGEGQYDLGEYGELETVVAWFEQSFVIRSQAASNGMNVSGVRDPLWANPSFCEAEESPLACEYRMQRASVAIIMFGTNDMLVLTPEQFDESLRLVVEESIEAGVIPVLSTFPRHLSYPERSIQFNQLVVQVALDYEVPLINLWLALEPLPVHGIDADGFHLNGPLTRAGDFTSARNLETGYPMRNLVTLQALDVIWREIMQAGE